MPYGDYHGPDKPDKGHEGGSCNRKLCQDTPANYYNHGSRSWYCLTCAIDIGGDAFNQENWRRMNMGHPMFETREMMNARKEPS